METTGRALVDHWKWASEKGIMNANTANGFRAACTQVLSVLDDWETLDVTAMDREDVTRRFQNKKAKEFKPESLAAYKRRFNTALNEFLDYVKDPSSWKPTSLDKPTTPRKEKRAAPKNGNGNGDDVAAAQELPLGSSSSTPRSGLLDHPFRLHGGRFAYLRLPADLTAVDAKRLSAYLNTLVLDDDVA